MSTWIIAKDEKNGLLDIFSGAAAAYSLRNLQGRSGKDSAVIRVRRSSDNTESDFTATEVSDGTLATWVGAGNNGFVRTWYDQSGNGNDATQTTTSSQPKVVVSGSIILSGSKPSVLFDSGSNNVLDLPTLSSSAQLFAFSVVSNLSYTGAAFNARFFDVLAGSYSFQVLHDGATGDSHMKNTYWQAGNSATRFSSSPTTLSLKSNWFDSASNSYWLNGNSISSVAGPSVVGAAGATGRIGARADLNSTTYLNGRYAELLLYQSDQSSNRGGIEANINAHYGIY